ncbi:MAG TPA: STAS domain-containing protein [Marinobacterium sp.]|nr:STAS domain-containing protein [Marinobacterium sp.]
MSSIPLPNTLTIQSVATDHAGLCELVKSAESPVRIDASAVEEIDTAGMQLILSLVNQLHSQSLTTEWHSPTDVLLQTADILGMSEALALPSTT